MPPAWSVVARQYLVQALECFSLVVLCFRSGQVSSGSALGLILRWQMSSFHVISSTGERKLCLLLTEQSNVQNNRENKRKNQNRVQATALCCKPDSQAMAFHERVTTPALISNENHIEKLGTQRQDLWNANTWWVQPTSTKYLWRELELSPCWSSLSLQIIVYRE